MMHHLGNGPRGGPPTHPLPVTSAIETSRGSGTGEKERAWQCVLQPLESWLGNEDMHRRGNAAFIFASLGDDRGFQVIKALLEDRSAKRAVFEIDSTGRPSLGRQIREDRYYAAHLLGDLKDPRAVPMLVPLLKDEEVNLIVPWSLGEIGDKSAIPPLIEALADSRLEMRAAALRALEKLEAKECRPPLRQIEDGCTIAVNP